MTKPSAYSVIGEVEKEAQRLDDQHRLFRDAYGFLIHPLITEVVDPKTLKILDVGTGTGLWMKDVESRFPGASLTGCDITSARFPKLTGGHFFIQDSTEPFDASRHNHYDLAHQRFMLAVFSKEDWAKNMAAMKSTLRPGRWIQLDEFDALAGDTPRTLKTYKQLEEVWEGLGTSNNADFHLTRSLESYVREAGFVDIQTNVYPFILGPQTPMPAELHALGIKNFRKVMEFMFKGMVAKGQMSDPELDTVEKVDAWLDQFQKDMEVHGIEFKYIVVTARKP